MPNVNFLRVYFQSNGTPRNEVWIVGDPVNALIGIRSPYHGRYIEELKRSIPYTEREWDGVHRVWYVNATYYNIVRSLCWTYYGQSSIHEKWTDSFRGLSPKPRTVKRRGEDLNKKLISAIQSITTDEFIQPTRKEDIIEILMDAWKDGSISNEDTLESIYSLINE
jgi:hypothetical protein